jgi:hypothetical protein
MALVNLEDLALAASLRQRAKDVCLAGQVVSLFDWCVHSFATQSRVHLWCNDVEVNVLQAYCPSCVDASWPIKHVIACAMSANGLAMSSLANANYYLAAVSVPDAVLDSDADEDPDLSTSDSETDDDSRGIRMSYFKKGLQVLRANASSKFDNGAATACLVSHRPCDPLSLKQWRVMLSRQILKLQNDPIWQSAFIACQNHHQPPCIQVQVGEDTNADVAADTAPVTDVTKPALSAASATELLEPLCGTNLKSRVALQLLGMLPSHQLDELRESLQATRKRADDLMKTNKPAAASHKGKRHSVRLPLAAKVAYGRAMRQFKDNASSKDWRKEFITSQLELPYSPILAKRLTKYMHTADKDPWLGGTGRGPQKTRGSKPSVAVRKNIISTQGRRHKIMPVRELLFQWFIDIRSALKGRLPLRVVLAKSKSLTAEYAATALRAGCTKLDLPVLNRGWVHGWRLQYGVSLLKPNRRFKLSRAGILLRLKIFWGNLIRVRHFARRTLHVDIGFSTENLDQKGWHVNQAGSKDLRTLDLKGAPRVDLKENHSATRERLSFMTWCANDPNRIKAGLPLEVCFKSTGDGSTISKGLAVPAGMSVRFSDSGSYREEHVYCFLKLHLPAATPERFAANDWRILYLDIYSGHLSERISKLAWDRMYVLLFHGGGLTGLCQPNDTWLHALFEKFMLDLEQEDCLAELALRPHSVPTPSRQTILHNAAQVWYHSVDHTRNVGACRSIGFSLDLDGKEARCGIRCCAVLCRSAVCAIASGCMTGLIFKTARPNTSLPFKVQRCAATILRFFASCCSSVQYSIARRTAQYSTRQRFAVKYSAVQYSLLALCIVQYSTVGILRSNRR